MIKKHPFRFILICLISLFAVYFLFNLFVPKYKCDFLENTVVIKGLEYEERWDWQVVNKDKFIGYAVNADYNFWDRLDSLFLPIRLYGVKGDEKKISYYRTPSPLSEFFWGRHLYRKDIELPDLSNIKPNRIELGGYYYNLEGKTYYYTEDKELIDEIMRIIRKYETSSEGCNQDIPEGLYELNEKGYEICFFTDEVPGSVYAFPVKTEDERVYIDINPAGNEKEYIEITCAICKLISEGSKTAQD